MSDPVKLSDIRTRIQRLADMENATDFASQALLNDLINQSMAELIDIIRSHFGHEYHRKVHTVTTDGSDSYPLPSDFLAVLWVEYEASDEDVRRLYPYSIHDAAALKSATSTTPACYRIGYRGPSNARMIDFLPNPSGAVINIHYIPVAPRLVNDDDSFDAVNGWEDYIVWDVVAAILNKEESDVAYAVAKREAIKRRIEGLAGATDQGSPETVGDVTSHLWPPFI